MVRVMVYDFMHMIYTICTRYEFSMVTRVYYVYMPIHVLHVHGKHA